MNTKLSRENRRVATKCANRIRKYWADRGKAVSVKIVKYTVKDPDGTILYENYVLESDMVNGLPQ